jgi:hypothetical protein
MTVVRQNSEVFSVQSALDDVVVRIDDNRICVDAPVIFVLSSTGIQRDDTADGEQACKFHERSWR